MFSPLITSPEQTEHREAHSFQATLSSCRRGNAALAGRRARGRLWGEDVINMSESRKSGQKLHGGEEG